LVDISNTPRDCVLQDEAAKLCLRRQHRQILLGCVGSNAYNSSNELTEDGSGSIFLLPGVSTHPESARGSQNANCMVDLSTVDFRLPTFLPVT
jgi:hypothetical protein